MEANLPQKIYFDESGFTGNNLLNQTQTSFSYASVASNDEEAREFVEYLIAKYNIQSGELKGNKLLKYNKGRKAISEIFKKFEGKIKISLSDKKYALAGKFFEYIFEPCFSEINSIFYNIDFHRFIATVLYVEFVARGAGAEDIFCEFERIMRNTEQVELDNLFSSSVDTNNSPILIQIREFAIHQKDNIKNELEALPGDGAGKWILDLTDTALFTLLANWGQEYQELVAVCDNSKPLEHNTELYNSMVGREDMHFSHIGNEKHPITFNLAEPLKLVDSKECHGIQLADALAAASVYAVSGATDNHANEWKEYIPEIAIYGSVFPEEKHMDLHRFEVQRNTLILHELHSRAVKNIPLIDGMPEFIRNISLAILQNPLPIAR